VLQCFPGGGEVASISLCLSQTEPSKNPREGERLFKEAIDIYAKNPKAPAFDYASAL